MFLKQPNLPEKPEKFNFLKYVFDFQLFILNPLNKINSFLCF